MEEQVNTINSTIFFFHDNYVENSLLSTLYNLNNPNSNYSLRQ